MLSTLKSWWKWLCEEPDASDPLVIGLMASRAAEKLAHSVSLKPGDSIGAGEATGAATIHQPVKLGEERFKPKYSVACMIVTRCVVRCCCGQAQSTVFHYRTHHALAYAAVSFEAAKRGGHEVRMLTDRQAMQRLFDYSLNFEERSELFEELFKTAQPDIANAN